MWGAIIGDIVGSRFEYNNFRSKNFEFFEDCEFTDDTVMTVAVFKAIKENQGKTIKKLKKAVIQEMLFMAQKYPDAGYGAEFCKFLFFCPIPYNSYGNGAAMRISGAGELCNSIEEVKTISKAVTEVSHNHPEGIKGAECVAVCIFLARQGKTKDEIKDYVIKNYYKEVKDMTCDNLRHTYSYDISCQGTVPQALTCFFEGKDFEDVIKNAIYIGGDSDTIGAIAGSIAEAYFGVPSEMVEFVKANYLTKDLLNIIETL